MRFHHLDPRNLAFLWRSAISKLRDSRAPLDSYFKAVAGLSKPILDAITPDKQSLELCRFRDLVAGDYEVGLLYLAKMACWGEIVGTDDSGKEVFRYPIDSERRYERILFTTRNDGPVRLRYESLVPSNIVFFASGVRQITFVRSNSVIDITTDSVCACLATHAPRIKLLKEAVDSLTPQVDHLFIYLNNMRQVPDFLVNHRHRSKIHYVLDTKSEYRAAAKFYFLKDFSCFWLVCDDDIIYPRDYRAVLIERLKSFGPQTLAGFHATIFKTTIAHYFNSVKELILFEQALAEDKQVHMLGTGTLALHSSLITQRDLERLLSHPTENDETLAIICKERGIRQMAIARDRRWLKSNPKMKTGLFEETMDSLKQQQKLIRILNSAGEWPELAGDASPAGS